MPGVVDAMPPRSTSGASGTLRVCTRRIASRPLRSGGCTATRRSNRPGRRSAWSSTSGRFVAAMTITPVDESKPSISVRIWLSVCSRSSLPPLKPAMPDVRERPMASSSSMKMIDGAASFAFVKRSRTRDAPMPTIASTNSDAAMEKNGTFASPATARASSVLPVPGGPLSRTPCGMRAPSLLYFCGIAQEVDDLGELLLRFFDAGDVLERDLVTARLVLARARAAERAECALHASRASNHEVDEADEEERRAEADEQALPPWRAGVQRLRVDDDVLPLEQQREGVRVRERGDLRLEELRLLRACITLGDGERALHGRPLRGDGRHVAALHLLQEVRAVRHADARRTLRRARCGVEVDEEQDRDPADPPADADARTLRLRGRWGARRVGAHARMMPFIAWPRPSRARRSWLRRGPCPRRRSTRARCARPVRPCGCWASAGPSR